MLVKSFLLFCFSLISLSGLGQTTRLTNFDELFASLNSGGRVRIVIHYAQCKRPVEQNDQSAIQDAITGMEIDTYEYFAAGTVHNKSAFVVFSNAKLITNPIGKGFVYNYGKVKISADNTVQVTAKYLHPKSFKVLMNETFNCKLNDGNTNEGINIFSN